MRLLIALLCLLTFAVPALAQSTDPAASGQTPPTLPVAAPQLLQRANAALQADDYERALLDYSLFIMLNPTFSRGYSGRAIVYLRQNEIDRALDDLEIALSNEAEAPDLRAALFGLRGRLYSQLDRQDDALADYSQAVELAPSPDTYLERALQYQAMQDTAAALADIDSAIELAPEEPVLLLFRAQLQTEAEDFTAAAAAYFEFMLLIEAQTVTGQPMESGDGIIITLTEGLVARIPFEGRSGDVFSAIARPQQGSQADPLLILLDPDDNPVRADDDAGGGTTALILEHPLEETGTYTLVVTHSLGGSEGDVGVQIQLQ
jgi:Tfp pilus assembly protein PilF